MLTIAQLMTPDPVSVREVAPLETAARFRHLPVIDVEGRVIGIVDDAGVFARGDFRTGAWMASRGRS